MLTAMKITNDLGDQAVLRELGVRVAHRRVQAGLTQAQLGRDAGASSATIERLEAGRSVQLRTLIRVLRRLELLPALDAVLPPAVATPMEMLERGGKRKRVRRSRADDDAWRWGDEA